MFSQLNMLHSKLLYLLSLGQSTIFYVPIPPKKNPKTKQKHKTRVPERLDSKLKQFIYLFFNFLVGQWHLATMTQWVVIKTKESELWWKTFW